MLTFERSHLPRPGLPRLASPRPVCVPPATPFPRAPLPQIGSAVAAGIMATPMAAFAANGQGAKLSLFGQAPLSSPYANEPNMYSPYSPWGNGEDSVYEKNNDDEVKFKIGKLKESAARFSNFEKYIQKKTWLEVYSESQRQMYDMRGSMNYLASYKGTKEVKAAAKDFYVKFEDMALKCRQKNQPAALAAYNDAKVALDKYLSLL